MRNENENPAPEKQDQEQSQNTDNRPQDNISGLGSVITHRGENIIYCPRVPRRRSMSM